MESQICNRGSPHVSAKLTDPKTCYLHILSDDALLEIFSMFLIESNFKQEGTPLQYLLSAVCRRWRELVINTPLLWTTVQLSVSPPFDTFLYFERSKSALIDVCLDSISSWVAEETYSARVSDAIAAHFPRIRSLSIRTWEPQDIPSIFRAWKDQEPMNLTTLNITTMRGTPLTALGSPSESPSTDGSFVNARTVKYLRLEGFAFHGFSPLTNLISLDVERLNTGVGAFHVLLDNCPLLTTLIIRQFDVPLRTSDNAETVGSRIDAPSLQSLAINVDNNHTSACTCFLPSLSAKNLEYLEIVYLWPTFTAHHRAIMSQLKEFSNLRRLRIRSNSIWMDDISFLSSLPATTHLEIVDFPTTAVNSTLSYILNLTNLRSITLDLDFATKFRTSLSLQNFSDFVHQNLPTLRCPISLRSNSTEELLSGHPLKEILGDMFTLLPFSTEKGFLDTYVNDQIFDVDFDMWQGDNDSDNEDLDHGDDFGGYDDDDEYDFDFERDIEHDYDEDDEYEDFYVNDGVYDGI